MWKVQFNYVCLYNKFIFDVVENQVDFNINMNTIECDLFLKKILSLSYGIKQTKKMNFRGWNNLNYSECF